LIELHNAVELLLKMYWFEWSFCKDTAGTLEAVKVMNASRMSINMTAQRIKSTLGGLHHSQLSLALVMSALNLQLS